jgi:ABC-2 type transport system permease protein
MIRNITQKERISAIRDKRFIILGSIILLLLLTAAVTGIINYRVLAAERALAQSTATENFKNQPDRHPHRVAHYGSYAFRPKSVLSFLDFGLDSYTGTMVYLEAHQQNSANFSQVQQSGAMIRFGEMTIAFVMQWLIPLLIIFLCFNTFTLEHEEGTLKVLLSQGISMKAIAKAKLLGYIQVISMIVLPAFFFVFLFVLSVNDFTIDGGLVLRTLGFMFSYLLYFFIFIAGSILVSAFNQHSRTALVTLLGIWIFSIVLMPKALSNLGSSLYEEPSKAAMDASVHEESKNGIDGHDPMDERLAQFKQELLKKYQVDSLSQLPVNVDGLVMALGEESSSKIYQEHFDELVTMYEDQNRLSVWGGFINPYLAIRNISMSMAGTDFFHYVDFLNAAEKYRYQLTQHLNNLQATKVSYKDKATRLDNEVYASYPPFFYQGPAFIKALSNVAVSIAALIFWTALVYALIIITMNKKKNLI